MNELEELSNLAQVAEIAERYEDASKYIEELIRKKKDDLTKDEKNIFYKTFKYIIKALIIWKKKNKKILLKNWR